ncbi:uncharacterized protein LOC142235452 [Haematobia irritans]|uniref:uncharacterized protein LOC142235452 n=1 Tax=Haematobia irritans TaxID=7368 RepID=UPI003F50280E
MSSGLVCINEGRATFRTAETSSAIDITLLNNMGLRPQWSVLNEKLTNSNHLPIIVELCEEVRRVCKKTNYTRVGRAMANIEVGASIETFNSNVGKIIESCTVTTRESRTAKIWWDQECIRLFRIRPAARKRYYSYRSLENLLLVEEADNEFQKYMRQKKNDNYKEYLAGLSTSVSPKEFWSKIKNIKGYGLPKMAKNSWNEDQNKEYLGFISSTSRATFGIGPDVLGNTSDSRPSMATKNLEKSLRSKNPKSAADADLITYGMILNMNDENRTRFCNMTINIWNVGNIPECWRIIKISPIPKPGKDITMVQNYRPIALFSVPLKLLESQLKEMIQTAAEERELIPHRSYAFRPHRSISNCVNDLINSIAQYKSSGQYVLGLCVDVEKAYDCVDVYKLVNILTTMNINSHITK